MVAKSVIEIDVNDAKFKAFQQAFDRYQKILDQQSKKWEQINKAFDLINKKQKDFNKSVQDNNKSLKDAAYITGTIARNMASAALSAAKWLAFGAVGGGFGLGSLAASASDYRRTAQGLGISTGQLRASGIAYDRAFNAQGVLSNIANLQNDPVGMATLSRLGIRPGQNPADQLGSSYKNAVQLFKQFGQNPVFAKSLGLTDVYSLEELRRGANMTAKDLDEMDEEFKKSKKIFELDDRVSKAWQDFWYALKKNSNELEVNFLKALKDLIPELTKFAQLITDAITGFLKSKEAQDAIKNFVEYLKSAEFKQDLHDFFENIKTVGEVMVDFAKFIDGIFGLKNRRDRAKELEDEKREGFNASRWKKDLGKSIAERNMNPGNLMYVGQEGAEQGEGKFAKFKSWQAGFKALSNQLTLYGTGQSKAAGYKKLTTLEDILPVYAPKSDNNDVEAYINRVAKETGFGRSEQLNFQDQNTMFKLMSAITNVETGKNSFTPQGVKVIVQDNTGSQPIVTVQSMGSGQ